LPKIVLEETKTEASGWTGSEIREQALKDVESVLGKIFKPEFETLEYELPGPVWTDAQSSPHDTFFLKVLTNKHYFSKCSISISCKRSRRMRMLLAAFLCANCTNGCWVYEYERRHRTAEDRFYHAVMRIMCELEYFNSVIISV